MLEQKGRFDSAIRETEKSQALDPNSVIAALEIGKLYCRVNKNEKAIETINKIKPQSLGQKAQANLVLGWAKRQIGDLETAEKLLIEAGKLNPDSVRALFELGKVYQAQGQNEKAIEAYHNALTKVLDQ